MKKYYTLLLAIVVFKAGLGQGYQISLKTPDFKSGITYLTYYMGSNFNVADSAAISNKGTAIFKGASKLPPGIYAIFLPGNRLRVEFLIDKEQVIAVTADTTDLINKTIITGSKENILYDQYQKFASSKGMLIQQERNAYATSRTKEDSLLHEKNYNNYNKQLNEYREGIIKNQPNSMMAALLKAMKEPPVPTKVPVTKQDSLSNYYEYKNHYWDGITFMDDRIIRTPFFLRKLERYYREVLSPASDSIIRDVDYKLLLARSAPEMYKFLLNWLTDEYINPKYMGQDAVFVHLFEKYHSKGLSKWLNESQMDGISRRAYMLMSNLIGDKAADLDMLDVADNPMSLYNVSADYTVICFWDPNCGHCKEVVPRLDSIYKASWKQHNVKIFGVLTPDGKADIKPEWLSFINNHKMTDWVNVYQTKEAEAKNVAEQRPSFRQLYDVSMTPTLFLLDKEKRIIAKKLTWEQMNDLLEVKWKTPSSN
ncbi:MAG: redoxin domain-containing protein [Chitinophagaceae bacterium]|nr:redoxin domain-containing protein [Chitinophagaceae bacterium]